MLSFLPNGLKLFLPHPLWKLSNEPFLNPSFNNWKKNKENFNCSAILLSNSTGTGVQFLKLIQWCGDGVWRALTMCRTSSAWTAVCLCLVSSPVPRQISQRTFPALWPEQDLPWTHLRTTETIQNTDCIRHLLKDEWTNEHLTQNWINNAEQPYLFLC